jgi:TetR/AcrR family transcriptional repressor of mexJK operon
MVKQSKEQAAAPQPIAQREKEKVILDAARKRFAHYGYQKVTMEEVADDVGVVKGALYYYFPTKESLFEAVIRDERKEFSTSMESMLATCTCARDMMNMYTDKRIKFSEQLLNLSQLDSSSWVHFKAHFHKLFTEFDEEECAYLQSFLARGVKEKQFAVGNPRESALLFLHVLQGLRIRALRDYNHIAQKDEANALLRHETKLFTKIFLCGIARTSTKENA